MLNLLSDRLHVERFSRASPLLLDFFLQQRDRVNQLLRTGWASWNVDINLYLLFDALHKGIVIENSALCGSSAHRDHPLRFRHLLIELTDNRRHFI